MGGGRLKVGRISNVHYMQEGVRWNTGILHTYELGHKFLLLNHYLRVGLLYELATVRVAAGYA